MLPSKTETGMPQDFCVAMEFFAPKMNETLLNLNKIHVLNMELCATTFLDSRE